MDAWVLLGAVRKARGDLPRAAEALRRAIAIRPGSWTAHAALATVLTLAGDDEGSRRASAEAERRRTEDQRERTAVVMTAVGVSRLDAGDADGARERFAAAVAVAATYAPAHYHLGRALHRLGRIDDARAAFAKAQQLNPSLVSPLGRSLRLHEAGPSRMRDLCLRIAGNVHGRNKIRIPCWAIGTCRNAPMAV